MPSRPLTDQQKSEKLAELGRKMQKPGANVEALMKEVDKILGMPSEPGEDPAKG